MAVVKTILFGGTDFNRDHRGELISELYHAAVAAKPNDTVMFDGPGSVGTLTKEGPYHRNQKKKNRSKIRQAINRQLDRALGKSGMDNNAKLAQEYIEKAIKEISASDDPDKSLVLNMAGWSRGAVTAVATANIIEKLKKNYPNVNVEVNLFLVDPVPGPTNTHKDKNQIIPPVVKNATVLYANDEKRPHMRPAALRIDGTQNTDVNIVRLPTDHSGLTQHLREETSAVTSTSWNLACGFLTKNGSELDKSQMQYYDTTTGNISVKKFQENESNENNQYKKLDQWANVVDKLRENEPHSRPGRGKFRVIKKFTYLVKVLSGVGNSEFNTKKFFYYKDYENLFKNTCPAIYDVFLNQEQEEIINQEKKEDIQQEIAFLRENGCDSVLAQLNNVTALKSLILDIPAHVNSEVYKKADNHLKQREVENIHSSKQSSSKISPENETNITGRNSLNSDKKRREDKRPGNNHFNYEIIKYLTGVNHKIPSTHDEKKDEKLDKLLPIYKIISLCDYYGKMATKALKLNPQAFQGKDPLRDMRLLRKDLIEFAEKSKSSILQGTDKKLEESIENKLQGVKLFTDKKLQKEGFLSDKNKKFSTAIYEFMRAQTALYRQVPEENKHDFLGNKLVM